MARSTAETMTTLNVNYSKGKGGTRVSVEKYGIIRKAVLAAVPGTRTGIVFADLPDLVGKRLSKVQRSRFGSIGWYTTTVKLDLEARGLIERIEGSKPQRLRRVK